MPGLVTPAEAAEMRQVIEAEAAAADRTIDDEHFGMNISWVPDTIDDIVRAGVANRRPDLAADDVIGVGVAGLTERINAFLDVGFSKFVIRPAVEPDSWAAAVEQVAEVVNLQT